MDEPWVRVALVGGALVVAGLIALWQRRANHRPIRAVGEVALEPGVYLFSSTACPTCGAARKKLVSSLGATGFTEYEWETNPGLFAEVGVDAVPAVLLVDGEREARLFPGQPERAIRAV